MSNDTFTPKWTFTRAVSVDAKNFSITYQGESEPWLEIEASRKTTLNTPVTLNGSLVVRESLSVTGTVEATGGVVGYGAVPIGAILLWSGNPGTLPKGWFLCNGGGWLPGGQPFPDLRGQFVVGYDPKDSDYKAVAKKGGNREYALTIENLPKGNVLKVKERQVGGAPLIGGDTMAFNRNDGEEVSLALNGSSKAFDIRPTWYVLAYIIYGGPQALLCSGMDPRACLRAGEFLSLGQSIVSPSGRYAFVLEEKGLLCFWDKQDNANAKRLWTAMGPSSLDAVGTKAAMQTDGNFVLYDGNGTPKFSANTYGKGAMLYVTDQGKVCIADDSKRLVWSVPG